MQFGAKFIANAQAPVAVKPSEGALDDPAPAPEAFTRLLSAPRNACCDAPLAQQVATERMVIALVGMQLVGPAARSSRQAGHGRQRRHQRREHLAVMPIGRRPLRHQRQAALLKQQVMLAAGFAAIGRIRSGVGTPEGGKGTLAESRLARSQAIWSCSRIRIRAASYPVRIRSRF